MAEKSLVKECVVSPAGFGAAVVAGGEVVVGLDDLELLPQAAKNPPARATAQTTAAYFVGYLISLLVED
jgi:hypothetical protein